MATHQVLHCYVCISIRGENVYFTKRGRKGHFTRSSFRRWIPFSLGNVWNVASSWKWRVNRLSFPQLQDSMGILYTLVHGTEIRAETVHKGSPGRVRQSWVKCQRARDFCHCSIYSFVVLANSLRTMTIKWYFPTKTQQMMLSAGSVVETKPSKPASWDPQWGRISKIACCSSVVEPRAACSHTQLNKPDFEMSGDISHLRLCCLFAFSSLAVLYRFTDRMCTDYNHLNVHAKH